MKLSLIFLAGCISVSLTYGQLPFEWQQRHLPQAKSIPSYMTLIDYGNDAEEETDNGSWNPDDHHVWRHRDANNIPPLRQYHHNEHVNQFYYPMAPSYVPTAPKDHVRITSRQKMRPRPFVRPVPDNNMMANNARFFGAFSNMFFPSALYSYLSSYSTSAFSTVTTYLILNSTLTTTVMTSCIPVLSFSTSALANVGCRRRRHLMDEAVVTGDEDDIQRGPDYISNEDEDWMGSSLVDSFGRRVDPEILSSKEETAELSSNHLSDYLVRRARSAHFTITSTFTSYSFYTVNSTKTAFIGSSLLCMPSGFKTC